jgi:LPS sulfotransferase NodH
MQPHQSFRIWFTQRSGSTLLCQGLTDTGWRANPESFFNLPVGETLQDKYGVHSYPDFREKLWELGTSPNGVFGIKHSIHHTYYRYLLGQLLPSTERRRIGKKTLNRCWLIFSLTASIST